MEEIPEMVERVAKAIAKAICTQNAMLELDEDECGYFDDYDNKGYDCRVVARAVIEAMRDPTDAMIAACNDAAESIQGAGWIEIYRRIYRAMIDAALSSSTRGE